MHSNTKQKACVHFNRSFYLISQKCALSHQLINFPTFLQCIAITIPASRAKEYVVQTPEPQGTQGHSFTQPFPVHIHVQFNCPRFIEARESPLPYESFLCLNGIFLHFVLHFGGNPHQLSWLKICLFCANITNM